MSTFSDYKAYKRIYPQYNDWKVSRQLAEAKRVEYLQKNPSEKSTEDIQKSKAILRAIDVMDEYSQQRAEDMEVATEFVVGNCLSLSTLGGATIGLLCARHKPVQNFISKYIKVAKNNKQMLYLIASAIGGIIGTLPAFPMFVWAAKAEVGASRQGRYEAMRKDLKDPKLFATLTPEQEELLNKNLEGLKLEKKSDKIGLKKAIKTVKEGVFNSGDYIKQKKDFEKIQEEDKKLFDKKLTPEEIEKAKSDQQLLTKLVERIDIASQDYAENAELATSALITTGFGFGALFALGYKKIAKTLKLKNTSAPAMLGVGIMLLSTIFATTIQKQAARVGRFKAKQELMNNPEQLIYVNDDKIKNIDNVEVQKNKKMNILEFLKVAWKNNKEFEEWKKTEGAKEKQLSKALENIELTEEQLKDAKRVQINTFKTFNKVDEKSQKYSEGIEAIGNGIEYPISYISSGIASIFAAKHLDAALKSKPKAGMAPMMAYVATILVSVLPSLLINAYITKEQKRASRTADMLAINEMQDYRHFADYSAYKVQQTNDKNE